MLHIDLFTTLDGVAQAPGGPDEDRDGGFPFGGWQAPHMDELARESVTAGIEAMDALLLGPDLVAEVMAVRDRHESTHVIGSVNLVQTLVAARLFDVLTLWVYPVVLGQGKKVFPDGVRASGLRLLEPPVAGSSGAVQLRYAPTGADPETGTVGDLDG